jgi:hypothetical protein
VNNQWVYVQFLLTRIAPATLCCFIECSNSTFRLSKPQCIFVRSQQLPPFRLKAGHFASQRVAFALWEKEHYYLSAESFLQPPLDYYHLWKRTLLNACTPARFLFPFHKNPGFIWYAGRENQARSRFSPLVVKFAPRRWTFDPLAFAGCFLIKVL